MADAGLELQKAIIAKLRAEAALTAIVAQRIYDQVPASPTFPYTSLGRKQRLPNDGSCSYRGQEHNIQIDAWSRAVGFPETEAMIGAIYNSLHYATLTLTGFTLSHIAVRSTETLNDPDGLTKHGVVMLRAFTQPSD